MKFNSDDLSYPRRYFRVQHGKLSFGPTGDRLFVDYLDKAPGFKGRIDFIHKINLTEIFTIETDPVCDFSLCEPIWYPDRLEQIFRGENFSFKEVKFITQNDLAVSIQNWENTGKKALKLKLSCHPVGCKVQTASNNDVLIDVPTNEHGYATRIRIRCLNFDLVHGVNIPQNEDLAFTVVASFENSTTEKTEVLSDKLDTYAGTANGPAGFLRKQKSQYASFFKSMPNFSCSDEVLNKTWLYRWYILRNCLAKPDFGNFHHLVMFEGRSHKMTKEPLKPTGWEFTKLIPLTTPLHLFEMVWANRNQDVQEMILSLLDSQDEDGLFHVMLANSYGSSYANFSIWAIYQYVLISGDIAFVKKIIPKLKRFIAGNIKVHGCSEDPLQIEWVHQLTGKEYQPSYWYFNNYPKDPYDKSTYTPLKRVDRSVYHYLNLVGLSNLCALSGDTEGQSLYAKMSKDLENAIHTKMWDSATDFYYDLHFQTDEKAMVKNITGFYPFWAGIANKENDKALSAIFDPQQFNTPYPFPSVSKQCLAYQPNGGWMGTFIKGRDGCVWDGPAYPYTNGIMIDLLGRQSRVHKHQYDAQFGKFLHAFALEHFRGDDIQEPYLVEHYNPETGELLSDDVDYNHSFFISLIMRYVVGITVTENQVIIDPLDIGLSYFSCTGIHICGHTLDVIYSSNQPKMIVSWDGKVVRPQSKRYYVIEKETFHA